MAAGKGNRISSISENKPKSFLEINNKRIFDYQIESLQSAGIKDIVVVVGYQAELFISEYKSTDINFIINPFYANCNVLGSLWFALNHLSNGFYFLHADVFCDPSIIQDLVLDNRESILCVEKKDTVEEEMKVKLYNNKVEIISKELDTSLAYGEFTGIGKFGVDSSSIIVNAIRNRIEKMHSLDLFFESVLQDCINDKSLDIDILDIGKRHSIEIDFPQDFQDAIDRYNEYSR